MNEKYGNRSRIGMLISMEHDNLKQVRMDIDKDQYTRKINARHCSEFNKRHIEMKHKGKQAKTVRFPSTIDVNEEAKIRKLQAAQRVIY